MASFGGTTQKCMACDKTVYLVDKLTADGRVYHKACFRCHHCRNTLKVYKHITSLYTYFICITSTHFAISLCFNVNVGDLRSIRDEDNSLYINGCNSQMNWFYRIELDLKSTS